MIADLPKPITVGVMKPCCADLRNREPWDQQAAPQPGQLLVERCRRCGCRHFTMRAEPGTVGLRGGQMGQ
jgi:hypothetical protein